MGNSARNIGVILSLQQQHVAALAWLDRAIASTEAATPGRPGLENMRAQRAWVLFHLGRRAEALEAATRAVSALEQIKEPNDGYALASARVTLARLLSRMGRPGEVEVLVRAALAMLERRSPNNPSRAMAECELGRAKVLQAQPPRDGPRSRGACRSYRAWGQADPEIIESLERLLAESR